MVKHCSTDLDLVFQALAGAPRRVILEELAEGGSTITHLAELFDMSLPAVSKHVRVLERAGLVTRTREGRVHRMSLRAQPLADAVGWIERYRVFWEERFDALAKIVERPRRRRRKGAGR
jgi:DNA-binding transcriptional ArsR family regulator